MKTSREAEIFDIPPTGLGTSGKRGDIGLQAMIDALEIGYWHIDTAQSYGNEGRVGQAIAQSGIPRSDICFTTKIAGPELSGSRLAASLRRSLDLLTDFVDLALVHWPGRDAASGLPEYVEALAQVHTDGLARHIGVSNFNKTLIDEAIAVVGTGVIVNNQVEVHPFLQNGPLR